MADQIADQDYFADASGKLVTAGSPDAAFLVARKGTAISDEAATRYGIKNLQAAATYDAVADHEAKHGGETEAEAARKRQDMLAGVPDPDGPAVEGERGEDAKAAHVAPDTKAVSMAPANKAR